jgi:hypothetical protein
LQLEPPANSDAAGAGSQQNTGQQQHGDQHTKQKSQPFATSAHGVIRMAQKPERFQGDDRKNAGHKVEDDAANKGGQHGGEHRWPLRLVGLRVGGVVLLDRGQGFSIWASGFRSV